MKLVSVVVLKNITRGSVQMYEAKMLKSTRVIADACCRSDANFWNTLIVSNESCQLQMHSPYRGYFTDRTEVYGSGSGQVATAVNTTCTNSVGTRPVTVYVKHPACCLDERVHGLSRGMHLNLVPSIGSVFRPEHVYAPGLGIVCPGLGIALKIISWSIMPTLLNVSDI